MIKGMKFLNIVLIMLMAFVNIALSATPPEVETYIENREDDTNSYDSTLINTETVNVDHVSPHDQSEQETTLTSSLRGFSGRFLGQKKPRPAPMTCDKYPRVCRTKGSPGPDCCRKKCVNVMTDKLNCGLCGRKCKYPEICCRGECVNPLTNRRHCGGCNNRCKKGNMCVYGMCSYA